MSRTLAALAVASVFVVACEPGLPAGTEPHREFNFVDMADQPKLKPQRADLSGQWATGMQAPPAGAVPIEDRPYRFSQKQGEDAGTAMQNPLAASAQVLERGKFLFENVCIVCHGPEGAGDGSLTKVFPKPPSLLTQKLRDWSDGRIFHVPMRGQGSMPKHSTQLEDDDIWAIVHYVRSLQARLPVAPPPPVNSAPPGAGQTPQSPEPPATPDAPGGEP